MAATWWLGRVVDGDTDEVEQLDVKIARGDDIATTMTKLVNAALKVVGKQDDWTIYTGDNDGPDREVAYHAGRFGSEDAENLYVLEGPWLATVDATVTVGSPSKNMLTPHPAPEALALIWESRPGVYPMRKTHGGRGGRYPGEICNFDRFADSSYGNDVCDSVVFSIGDVPYIMWVAPARVFDRSEEMLDSAYTVEALRSSDDLDNAIENRDGTGETIISTNDPTELMGVLNDLWENARQLTISRSRQQPGVELLRDFAKLSYNGWVFKVVVAGYQVIATHPHGDHKVEVSVYSDRPEIEVEVMEVFAPGHPIEQKKLPFPRNGRTAEGLLAIVRHTLDAWQPAPPEEDLAAARFGQLEYGAGKHTAGGPDVDDSAERFRLIELNPRRRANPPQAYRIQKVVSKLQRGPGPTTPTRGAIASSPGELVSDTLADYLAEKSTETFLVLHINVRNAIIGYTEYTEGSTSQVGVSPVGIFQDALGIGSVAIITVHNHPTGDARPSEEDVALWARLREAGNLIGIPLVDNLIVGDGQYYSQAQDTTAPTPSRSQLRAAAERRKRS